MNDAPGHVWKPILAFDQGAQSARWLNNAGYFVDDARITSRFVDIDYHTESRGSVDERRTLHIERANGIAVDKEYWPSAGTSFGGTCAPYAASGF